MIRVFKGLLFGGCTVLIAGCVGGNSERFIFTADLPPKFAYYAKVKYAPAKDETCTVTLDDNPYIGLNRKWRTEYEPTHELPVYRTVKGCRLAIYRIDLDIYATYGDDRGDFGTDSAVVVMRDGLEERYKGVFDVSGEGLVKGQCQWLFRTQGGYRRLSKGLDCKGVDAHGEGMKGHPVVAYALSELGGKTIKLKIDLAGAEKPAIGDTWIKFPGGWKRCMGDGFEDQYAFCAGNHKDFSTFLMPDGKECSIYPSCTE